MSTVCVRRIDALGREVVQLFEVRVPVHPMGMGFFRRFEFSSVISGWKERGAEEHGSKMEAGLTLQSPSRRHT